METNYDFKKIDIVGKLLDEGDIELKSKNYNPAILKYKEVLKYDTNNYYAYLNLSKAYSKKNNIRLALKYINKAIDLLRKTFDLDL